MNANFKSRILSYRQFTFLYHIYRSGSFDLSEILKVYQRTALSCAERGYLRIEWNKEAVKLSKEGSEEMESFLFTPLGALYVKNNPQSRQDKFASSLRGKRLRKAA